MDTANKILDLLKLILESGKISQATRMQDDYTAISGFNKNTYLEVFDDGEVIGVVKNGDNREIWDLEDCSAIEAFEWLESH